MDSAPSLGAGMRLRIGQTRPVESEWRVGGYGEITARRLEVCVRRLVDGYLLTLETRISAPEVSATAGSLGPGRGASTAVSST